jgi:hypothetical protein
MAGAARGSKPMNRTRGLLCRAMFTMPVERSKVLCYSAMKRNRTIFTLTNGEKICRIVSDGLTMA